MGAPGRPRIGSGRAGQPARLAAALVVWLLSESFPSAAEDRTTSGGAFREGFSPFVSEKLSARARRAVNDAAQLLADPGCRAVLLDFQDRAGRPLHATLDQAGQDAVGYLAGIRFADGSGRRPCAPGTTLAPTRSPPGSRGGAALPG